ncbi:hypothetical protein AArcSl_1509 [Halalkaliarchaeum desulfuricum]|uniref:CRISPR-associated exonuclease Cas4 n=1 Tax=Halalkaliarchaeum desulfuricum TaxID=2055893 RepID=A0A343TJ66_9EURY|nr:hypothetical protein [Halalkaliarchaeum desulfuricum]AUX09138.1 hypothetical protein AArcSl_1509 [Halalkaliarchaeum desulfuricum]
MPGPLRRVTGSRSDETVTFGDLSRGAYCPRQLYHARKEDDREPPPDATDRIELAFRYPSLLDASDRELREAPIDVEPDAFRRNLARLRTRDDWDELASPSRTRVLLSGKDCRGIAHKIVGDPGVPTIVSPGTPPDQGTWNHHRVRAVAAAKALSWEQTRQVSTSFVEYPAHGVVRTVELTTRAKAAYRSALRAVRAIDGPPPRANDARCEGCEYSQACGTRTRSLRSLLGI